MVLEDEKFTVKNLNLVKAFLPLRTLQSSKLARQSKIAQVSLSPLKKPLMQSRDFILKVLSSANPNLSQKPCLQTSLMYGFVD
jgi:hypothetical protein